MRGFNSTPTGDRAKAVIRKIDRWCLKQEDESSLDWQYQEIVDSLEALYKSMQALDGERKERDREEAHERRLAAKGGR